MIKRGIRSERERVRQAKRNLRAKWVESEEEW